MFEGRRPVASHADRSGSHARAAWINREIVPLQAWLKSWLERRGQADAEDIVQDCMIRLLQTASVDHICNARHYLRTTALSVVTSKKRRDAIVRFEPIDESVERLACAEPLPSDIIAGRQELALVEQHLQALDERARQIVIMRRLEGLSIKAAAQRLGVSGSTVEKRLLRAERHLVKAVGRERSKRRVPAAKGLAARPCADLPEQGRKRDA